MKIAVIGAGFTGLTAAYDFLKEGHEVTIFEKDQNPGGLAIGYKEKEWKWTLEAFYHHWFTNDAAVLHLAKELDYPVIIKRPKTSSYINGHMYQLDSLRTLLSFQQLSLPERIQMGLVVASLRFNPYWRPLEKITATGFLKHTIGEKAYRILWEPLLAGKFGTYADTVSLAWFWARIVKRTTRLAYPSGGFLSFTQAFAKRIAEQGGKFVYEAEVTTLTQAGTGVSLGTYGLFDKVVVTLPSFAFLHLVPTLPETYKKSLMQLHGLGAVMLIMRLRHRFFKDGTYWLNVCDTTSPVLALVEHTNFMDSRHYNNEHLVYAGNYVPQDHPYFSMTAEALLKTYAPLLKKINPGYSASLIGIKKFSAPFAQPIIPTNYSRMIPPFDTPVKHVYLANMQQVYPWDRGTNYAVELGHRVVKYIHQYA